MAYGRTRQIKKIIKSRPVVEGAGVHLHRAFGHEAAGGLDPFLLFKSFGDTYIIK